MVFKWSRRVLWDTHHARGRFKAATPACVFMLMGWPDIKVWANRG